MSKHTTQWHMLIGSSIALFLAVILLFAGFLLPALSTPQEQTTTSPLLSSPPSSSSSSGTTTGQATSPPLSSSSPLTPEEQEQLTRLQNVIAATNQNLDETEKQIGGIVYTPRWSDPVWVEPDSAAVLVAYCLPGEFAESGQEILGGGFELEVLESYEVALPQNFTAWMMVIGNEDRQNRYPAAVGVVCVSDLNDAQTRVVSPQEQQQINNVISQFTQVTSIDQVINNIINNNNNNATNQNTTGGTTTPPPAGGTTTPPPAGGTTTPPGPQPLRCIEGFTFNPDTDQCENPVSGPPYCSPGEFQFDPADDACVSIVDPPVPPVSVGCPPQLTFNPDTDQCEGTQTQPPQCPPGYAFNPAIDQCEQTPTTTPGTPTTPGGTPTITASLSANPATYEGHCPTPNDAIQLSGTITSNLGNIDVNYRFHHSNGGTSGAGVLHFDQPGSQSVTATGLVGSAIRAGGSENFWAVIEILQPVQLQSNRAEYTITCTTTRGDTIAPSLSVPVDRLNLTIYGQPISYEVSATDNVDGTARLDANNMLIQEDNVGGSVTISCIPDPGTISPIGDTTVQCSATDAAGNEGTASFIVAVVPTTSTPPNAPSSGGITAYLSANPATHQGPCPGVIRFTGTITDSVGNRDIVYRFIFFIEPNDTVTHPEKVIHFNQPGTTGVDTSLNNELSSQGWVAIEILQPVQLQSNRAEWKITCTDPTGGAAQTLLQAENDTTTATDEQDTTTAPPATTDEEEEGGGEDTTTDGEEGGGGTTDGTGGTGADDTDNADQSPPATTTDGAGDTGGADAGGTDGEPQ